MEIKKQFKNELFQRQEIEGELESENSPNFDEVKRFVSEKLKSPEEAIEIRSIKGGFGRNVFHIKAYIYNSKEELNKMQQLVKTKKQRKEEKTKSEEKPAEQEAEKESEEKPAESD